MRPQILQILARYTTATDRAACWLLESKVGQLIRLGAVEVGDSCFLRGAIAKVVRNR
jgi:hypothetical protein